MQIGLIGLPQAGKKTLLRLLTGVDARSAAASNGPGIPGICRVRDPRVDRLAALYRPRQVTAATIQYLLMPDVTKDSAHNQELFNALALVDALGLVIRAFPDETVFHLEGSVDPLRDLQLLLGELLLNDLLFIEKRLERIAKEQVRRAGVDRSKERDLLAALQAHLNEGLPLRSLPLDAEALKLLSGAPLLTRKPLLAVLNVGEGAMCDQELLRSVSDRVASARAHVVQVSAKIEEELAELDDPAERAAFLQELGIDESAIDRLTRVSYDALGFISYFTVGSDEVRAWTIRRGATAAEAGGAIHSDIERGFIRAELMAYQDLVAFGSEHAVAGAGKASLKGREYVVQDGDVLSFRFSA